MFKAKKIMLYILSIAYLLLTLIEFIRYIFFKSNLFGMIYLIIAIVMIFLLIPTIINYNDKYSNARISKIIIFVLIGVFGSYFLKSIVINNMNHIDSSLKYSDSIFIIKNILKPIIYLLMLIFIIIESEIIKIVKKRLIKKEK